MGKDSRESVTASLFRRRDFASFPANPVENAKGPRPDKIVDEWAIRHYALPRDRAARRGPTGGRDSVRQ